MIRILTGDIHFKIEDFFRHYKLQIEKPHKSHYEPLFALG